MVMNDMTDDGKWGAEIAVDGNCQPAFVANDDRVKPIWRHGGEDHEDYPGDCIRGWGDSVPFIRLPASHPHYRQAQTQTLTAQEHLARMEAFVRKAAAHVSPMAQYSVVRDHLGDEARALVAEMEPVADGDLVIARDMAAEEVVKSDDYYVVLPTKDGVGRRVWGSEAAASIRDGQADNSPAVSGRLAAIRRGRELARGEGR